ncbi:MAG: 2OG-Fe(II) oxygenase [Phycisphaerales bacterium]|nr:2OG-Fe(II) oxygenase [Hyphomonadaceae bacterium]
MGQTQLDPRSQLRLAHLMLTGRQKYLAPDEPIRLVAAACAQKSAEALLYHAALAARGHGRQQNFDDAFAYVAEAAALGDTRAKGQLMALGKSFDRETWFGAVALVQHHAAPRVFTAENFLPKPVCAWLIKQARKNLVRAPVQSAAKDGAFVVDNARSNSAAGTSALQPDLVVQMVNLRIAATIGLPLSHQEPTNFLHYARGQQYAPHFDFFAREEEAGFASELQTVGQRVATVLVYLNEDYEGGATEFPRLDWRFKGKTGDALIFWNLSAAGEREMASLHAGTPVTKGDKWLLSKWVRQRPTPLI